MSKERISAFFKGIDINFSYLNIEYENVVISLFPFFKKVVSIK